MISKNGPIGHGRNHVASEIRGRDPRRNCRAAERLSADIDFQSVFHEFRDEQKELVNSSSTVRLKSDAELCSSALLFVQCGPQFEVMRANRESCQNLSSDRYKLQTSPNQLDCEDPFAPHGPSALRITQFLRYSAPDLNCWEGFLNERPAACATVNASWVREYRSIS
jgi:hypothetical protein